MLLQEFGRYVFSKGLNGEVEYLREECLKPRKDLEFETRFCLQVGVALVLFDLDHGLYEESILGEVGALLIGEELAVEIGLCDLAEHG